MSDILKHKDWTEWKPFPDPRKREYLFAPFGFGVYQLRNMATKKYVLFGHSKYAAHRMSSLLPKPLGQGTRINADKRNYVLRNIGDIHYRTIAFELENGMKAFERNLKDLKIHIFNEGNRRRRK